MTLRARLSLLVVGAVAAGLVTIGTTTWTFVSRRVHHDLDAGLQERARAVVEQTVARRLGEVILLPNVDSLVDATTFIQVVDLNGDVQARSENLGRVSLPIDAATRDVARAGSSRLRSIAVGGAELRIVESPLALRPPAATEPVGVVQVARDVAGSEAGLRRLRVILVVGGLGTLVLTGGVALMLTRAALRPLAAMQASAETVATTGDPALRLRPATSGGDEVARLASAFDRMLERLQASGSALGAALDSQRRFVADASHELRTPLTSASGNIDIVDRNPEMPGEERRQALGEAADELARMARLVEGLLTLARADAGAPAAPATIVLSEVLEEAHHRAVQRAGGRSLTLDDALGAVSVHGSDDALLRMLDNLYDNAIKYTPPDGAIETVARAQAGWATISIADTGSGIPAGELPRIFERFYRSPEARSRDGSGLGLAIVHQTAALHGGTVSVSSRPGHGSTFTVALPVGGMGTQPPER